MFLNEQELQLHRNHDRFEEMRREAANRRLVREAKLAAREARQHDDTNQENRAELVNRLFSLFF